MMMNEDTLSLGEVGEFFSLLNRRRYRLDIGEACNLCEHNKKPTCKSENCIYQFYFTFSDNFPCVASRPFLEYIRARERLTKYERSRRRAK